MRSLAFGLAIVAASLSTSACGPREPAAGCVISGPTRLAPAALKQVRLGMSRADLEKALGKADYSPIEGQYYFSTGGMCPLEDTGRTAPCGVIAEFRAAPDYKITPALQSCTWGAIGE